MKPLKRCLFHSSSTQQSFWIHILSILSHPQCFPAYETKGSQLKQSLSWIIKSLSLKKEKFCCLKGHGAKDKRRGLTILFPAFALSLWVFPVFFEVISLSLPVLAAIQPFNGVFHLFALHRKHTWLSASITARLYFANSFLIRFPFLHSGPRSISPTLFTPFSPGIKAQRLFCSKLLVRLTEQQRDDGKALLLAPVCESLFLERRTNSVSKVRGELLALE